MGETLSSPSHANAQHAQRCDTQHLGHRPVAQRPAAAVTLVPPHDSPTHEHMQQQQQRAPQHAPQMFDAHRASEKPAAASAHAPRMSDGSDASYWHVEHVSERVAEEHTSGAVMGARGPYLVALPAPTQ